jgi:ribulose-5-phosphate 4-epimerase/fuculose-1-phosphate aldolase
MGADMTLYCAPACDLTPPRIERLALVIRSIPDEDPNLTELMESLGYDDPEYAKACILEKCQASQYESRDVITIGIPGCPYLIRASGGLSWGDDPTEAFAILEHVERCPQAWQVLEEFAREDLLAAKFPG